MQNISNYDVLSTSATINVVQDNNIHEQDQVTSVMPTRIQIAVCIFYLFSPWVSHFFGCQYCVSILNLKVVINYYYIMKRHEI